MYSDMDSLSLVPVSAVCEVSLHNVLLCTVNLCMLSICLCTEATDTCAWFQFAAHTLAQIVLAVQSGLALLAVMAVTDCPSGMDNSDVITQLQLHPD